jgi:hypothetical protein
VDGPLAGFHDGLQKEMKRIRVLFTTSNIAHLPGGRHIPPEL